MPWYAAGQHQSYPEPNFQMYTLADEHELEGRTFHNHHVDVRGDGYKLARKMATDSTV